MPVLIAALMLAVAMYCAARPLVARLRHRSTELDADLVHVVMGVVMAAMIEQRLPSALSSGLVVVFAVAVAWFAGGAAIARLGRRGDGGHHLAHALACVVMAVMLLAAAGNAAAASPVVAFGLVLALACSLVFATGRLSPGLAAQATAAHGLAAQATAPGLAAQASAAPGGAAPGIAWTRRSAAPPVHAQRLAGLCQIAMGAAMIWMLLPIA